MRENYRLLPYRALSIYVFITLILSLFGPINYGYDYIFAFFVCIYMLSFTIITKIGMLSSYNYKPKKYTSYKNDKKLLKVLKVLLLIVLIIKIALLISSIKIYGIPEITNFYTMFAKIYSEMHHGEFKENFYRQIDSFTTFLYYITIFIGFFWYRRLKFYFKVILVLAVILDLLYQILFIGTQRSIITIFILFMVLLTKKSIDSNYNINYKSLFKIIILIGIILLIFTNVLSARKELWNQNYYKSVTIYNLDSLWLIFFKSAKLKHDICSIISYLTQGYYGMSLTFQTDFQWTYFLGGFRGINSILSGVIPLIPLMSDFTYPVRAGIIYNFNGYAQWFTIFPWLASDFTFIGALIYMGIVAKIYMKCWIQVNKYNNPIAFVLLVLLTIQYIFIVANNQLFVSRGESLATIVIFIIYLYYNKKFNYMNKRSYQK